MSEHTPGPWYVSRHEDYTEVWKDYGDERAHIATADDGWVESYANARLIAAAPDLLNACETAILSDDKSVKRLLVAAIAKAKGETE